MSGIEAVGLVLGAIPLIISALEHFQDGKSAVSTWRRHARVVQSLVRNLKTEQGKLYNTCETLLGGIVSPAKLEPMLNEPFGPLWQNEDTKERIERRLDHMYKSFQETVRDMSIIMEELKSNLGFDSEGQLEWHTGGAIKRNIMRASLVIKRSSYDQALQGLISKNQTLETIVMSSLRLEPSRGKRSRPKYLELFRKVVSSIYKALQLGLCRACPQKHGVSLQLFAPRLSLRGDEESVIGKLDFRVILSHYSAGLAKLYPPSWMWKEVKLQVDISSRIQKEKAMLPKHPSTEVMEGRRAAKRVKFSVDGSPQIQISQDIDYGLPETENSMSLTLPSKLATDKLCQALGIEHFGPICGYVIDPSVHEYGRFGVSRIDDIRDSCELSFISIRDVMETRAGWHQESTPSLPQKLALASTIASSILQLQNTPWLSMIMTSRTLYLARFDSIVAFNRVYISRTAPEDPCRHIPPCHGPCEDSTEAVTKAKALGNELMWALFVLLIEVILWRAIDNILSKRFTIDVAGTSPSEIFDYTTERGFEIVHGLLSQVTMAGGQEYCNAVESCLKLAFGYPNLDLGQEELRQQIYGNIITPIEESFVLLVCLILCSIGVINSPTDVYQIYSNLGNVAKIINKLLSSLTEYFWDLLSQDRTTQAADCDSCVRLQHEFSNLEAEMLSDQRGRNDFNTKIRRILQDQKSELEDQLKGTNVELQQRNRLLRDGEDQMKRQQAEIRSLRAELQLVHGDNNEDLARNRAVQQDMERLQQQNAQLTANNLLLMENILRQKQRALRAEREVGVWADKTRTLTINQGDLRRELDKVRKQLQHQERRADGLLGARIHRAVENEEL
ncbi:hypothetical protein NUW58_g3266 [Xylaria curta]|uniref:Uncharacterized protein n=1 Tax=Xylaria curta TaxID=42375 RepID=A0ACC1PEH4_9PEZI|nr:hypothetical protein NUW58_g3266 [Xylaria curta]